MNMHDITPEEFDEVVDLACDPDLAAAYGVHSKVLRVAVGDALMRMLEQMQHPSAIWAESDTEYVVRWLKISTDIGRAIPFQKQLAFRRHYPELWHVYMNGVKAVQENEKQVKAFLAAVKKAEENNGGHAS